MEKIYIILIYTELEHPDEIEDIGFMEYIDFGDLCFVEWPEKITEFLPQDRIIHVDIILNLKKCREYTIY
jgi:tRNA threonylcarbamoyladenosine biosynthesis protein TsaE